MKRMIAFFMCAFAMFMLKGGQADNLSVFDKVKKVVLVLDQQSQLYDDFLQNGDDFYYTFQGQEALKMLESLDTIEGVKGVNLYFSKELNLSYFQDKLDFLGEKSDIEGMEVYYGFYKHYKEFELIGGKKINVQLVLSEDCWILGLPIILTGF